MLGCKAAISRKRLNRNGFGVKYSKIKELAAAFWLFGPFRVVARLERRGFEHRGSASSVQVRRL